MTCPGHSERIHSSRLPVAFVDTLDRPTSQGGGILKNKYDRRAAWRKRNPWSRYVEWARRRCNDNDPRGRNYANYFDKGITCDLTARELKAVWERDRAHLLKKPSLDRIDPERGYTMFNVRFVPFDWNVRRAWDKNMQDAPAPEFT